MSAFKATWLHMSQGQHAAIAVLHRHGERVVIAEINRGHLAPLRSDEDFASEAAAFQAAQALWRATLPGLTVQGRAPFAFGSGAMSGPSRSLA